MHAEKKVERMMTGPEAFVPVRGRGKRGWVVLAQEWTKQEDSREKGSPAAVCSGGLWSTPVSQVCRL